MRIFFCFIFRSGDRCNTELTMEDEIVGCVPARYVTIRKSRLVKTLAFVFEVKCFVYIVVRSIYSNVVLF